MTFLTFASSQETWDRWSGSPALFTHIARMVKSLISVASDSSNYRIEVLVSGDIEFFQTPEEFKENVTPEALQHFTAVRIEARDPTIYIELEFNRTYPAVRLKAESKTDGEKPATVCKQVGKAIERGVPADSQQTLFYLAALTVAVVAYVSTNYLIKVPRMQGFVHNSFLHAIILAVPSIFFGAVLLIAYRRTEIAEINQTRLWRMIRIIGPVVTGVAIAAITKLLFKSG